MTWTWAASSVDQLWRSSPLSLWIALGAVGLVVLIIVVVLIRAEKSVANGALALITLVAVGLAVVATVRPLLGSRRAAVAEQAGPAPASVAAMACLDGLAGDAVEAACERPLFVSAEAAASAVSYTAAQLVRLSAAASPDKKQPPELTALRRAVERDRYGLVAHVLAVRDGCTPTDCAFYAVLGDHKQIAANMTERAYEGLVGRYALSWGNGTAPAPAAAPAAPTASIPTGRPMSGDFPSSSSIPPVSIMTSEPPPGASAAKPAAAPAARPAAPAPAQAAAAPTAPKKLTPKRPPAPPPAPAAPPPAAPAPPADDQ